MSLSLKVVINKEKTKVLFAEANSDFINVLLSFLTIPLGRIVTILQKHNGSEEASAIGSLTTLYKGLSELDIIHFHTRGAKEMLLNPGTSFQFECSILPIDVTENYFLCESVYCSRYAYYNISMNSDTAKCVCGRSLKRLKRRISDDDRADAFVKSPLVFIITDDLRVAPIVTGFVQTLSDFGITNTRGTEMKSLSLGLHEIRELLKLSLTSATLLTDMIMKSNTKYPQSEAWLDHIHQNAATGTKKIVIRAFLHKSTNKFLFAQATDEFVDLLLSFLTLRLGGVEFLFDSNTPFKNIDNLYRSVSNSINDKYFTTMCTKNTLLEMAHCYLSKNQFLPVRDEYVTKQTMCFVSDDLTMSPSLTLILNDVGIPLTDMKETELHIGINEALGILKASLTSKTALTDGLIKPLLKRLPKKERC